MTTNGPNLAWRSLAALLALCLIAASCGGGDDGDAAGPDASEDTAEVDSEGSEEEEEAADDSAEDSGDSEDAAPAGDGSDLNGDGVLQVAIMGECEGPFGGFHEDIVGGATLAMIEHAGATANSATSALDGFTGASVAGTDIELVGIGCGDDTPDTAIQEVRRLVEQDGAEVIIGPLSGDESIAMANFAKDNPGITIINGTAGAQETTLQVQAENYFRFNGDGAQWNAGIGDILHNDKGWETAAVIADDYSFGWTSAAGFIAEFCAAGGDVVQRVFPPLGTTDYSSFVAQLPDPDEVDGYFWVVGGTGTQASLEAFVNAKGDLNGEQHAGNLFFNPGLAAALGPGIAGAYVGGFASLPGDVSTPEIDAYIAAADAAWESLPGALSGNEPAPPSTALTFGFGYSYYVAGLALTEAMEASGGDISPEALQSALAGLTLDAPYGSISLDENRQAIVDAAVQQLVVDDSGEVVSETVAIVPGVDQTFGGLFSPDTPPPSRDAPECVEAGLPWIGNAIPVIDGVPQG